MHLVRNHSHNFGTPKYYIKDKKHKFWIFSHAERLLSAPKHRKINFGTNGVEWMDLLCNHFHNFSTQKQCIHAQT
jgi:hypothetical protein